MLSCIVYKSPPRLNFAAEQYQKAVKTNTGPPGLIVRTRVLPVETWKLLAHSALISGFALTTTLFPESEERSASLHAPQNPIMIRPAKTHELVFAWRKPKTSRVSANSHCKMSKFTCEWDWKSEVFWRALWRQTTDTITLRLRVANTPLTLLLISCNGH